MLPLLASIMRHNKGTLLSFPKDNLQFSHDMKRSISPKSILYIFHPSILRPKQKFHSKEFDFDFKKPFKENHCHYQVTSVNVLIISCPSFFTVVKTLK